MHLLKDVLCGHSIFYVKLNFPVSALNLEHATLKLSDLQFGLTMLFDRSAIRFWQLLAAKSNFHSAGKIRMYDIMIEIDEKPVVAILETNFPVWFRNAKSFIQIPESMNLTVQSGIEILERNLLKPS